jgi:hypothetical protein
MAISKDFRKFVLQLAPRCCFNPGRFGHPDDLYVVLPDLSGWVYMGTPNSEAQAFALMRTHVYDAFADEAEALWLRRHPELTPEIDVFGTVHYR